MRSTPIRIAALAIATMLSAARCAGDPNTPKAATKLAVVTEPSGATSGVVLATQPVVHVRDGSGATVMGASNPVTATLVGTGGTLSGTTTVPAANGVATFTDLRITGAGSYTLAFSAAGLATATSAAIVIAAAPATALAVATQPAGAVSGVPFTSQPVVQVRDAGGDVVRSATNAVVVTLNGAGGSIGGGTTAPATNGVAAFTDLKITGQGTYTLTFSSTPLTPVTSASIVVGPAAATQLALVTQPRGAPSGMALVTQPVVQVRDANGAAVAGASNAVTAALVGTGGTLSGTTTVAAANGVATFTDLRITGPGSYTLTFTGAGLTPVTSSAVTVTSLVSLALTPRTVTLPANGTQQFTATGTYSDGATQTLTAATTGTTYTAAGGTISASGLYVAPGTPGTYAIVAANSAKADTAFAVVVVAPGWTLVWSDEFIGPSGAGADTANWLYDIGTGYPGGPANWGTGEIEVMTNSRANVFLDGLGRLAIAPLRATGGGGWTSGRIETRRSDFEPPAGGVLAVEASIQQPNVNALNGLGYWPAFWMLGAPFRGNYTNWPGIGEIDVLENANAMNAVFSTLHCGTYPGGPCNEPVGYGSGAKPCAGCLSGFHVYRMEWDRSVSPQELRWYLDGVNYFTAAENQVGTAAWTAATNHGFMLILNVAIGGGFPDAFGGGPTAATVSGAPMLIDYVRVFKR